MFGKKINQFSALSPLQEKKTLHQNLEFTATEQYKLLRANLAFTLEEDVKCPIIGIVSSMRGEGKSTTAVNLAYVLALDGKKVLLIDGDLRLPTLAKKLDLENTFGVTDMLINYDESKLGFFKSKVLDNWYVMPSGTIPPNPSELLGSAKMEKLLQNLSKQFDYIILDLPPVNLVSDAIAVSPYITGMILVFRENYTQKKELNNCVRLLKYSKVRVLGTVMNSAKREGRLYSKYKKYYRYYKEEQND